MLRTNITGETMIFKNDKGLYSTSMSQKKMDGTYENAYISVSFKKGVDIPNKTKINVTKGWLSFSKYTKEENGTPKTYTAWRIFISEFVPEGDLPANDIENQDFPF